MPDYGAHDFAVVSGIAAATYPGTAQFTFDFLSTGFRLHNRIGAQAVYFSFDGATDHGRVAAGETFQAAPDYLISTGRVFLRLESGVGPNTADVTVWG